jgi:asparagine synthase (glutamine-hydrolysing)
MCGIVGVLQYQAEKKSQQEFINWALQSMHRRGPDSNGNWNDDVYHTGFVRLAIRDLTNHGNQPMHSQCGRYVLSFNGEIYNSNDFKVELEKEGIQFLSTSDTEVLLYALIKWKPKEILSKLNGMFAFAFYDKQEKKLVLARDRVGIKPLYVGYSNDGIVFSSQYDHIINHSFCCNNSFDAAAIALYLNLGFMPDKSAVVQNTMLFPHGHFAEVSETSTIKITEYYSYPFQNKKTITTDLNTVLQQSVAQQLVSDVPIGTFMSGGVDSTLITSYAVENKKNIQSFTIGVEDKKMDESDAAAQFASAFKTEHQCRFIKQSEVLQILQDNFEAYSEPFADYSSLPTLLLSKMAREKVTVVLSGDGGDELFWGYPRNQKIINASQMFRHNLLVRNFKFLKEKVLSSPKRNILKRHILTDNYIEYYYKSVYINGSEAWVDKLMNVEASQPYFLKQLTAEKKDLDEENTIMNKIRKLEMDIHLQRILIKVDRASMFNSIEVRVPLLDNSVLDYSAGTGFKDCIHATHGKSNLKKLLAAKTNPQLVYQPKKGFTVPLAHWMRNELFTEISDCILNMPPHLSVYFNKKTIQLMLSYHKSGKQDNSWILWAIYALVKWDSVHRNKFKN